MAMKVLIDSLDREVVNHVLEIMPLNWARPYQNGVFMCTHPWVDLIKIAIGKYRPGIGDVISAYERFYLADRWYSIGTEVPSKDGESLPFRFELDQAQRDPILRPNGAVHMELLIAIDYVKQEGITLGVADGGSFGLHYFAPNTPGDGWHNPSATITLPVRWVHPDDIFKPSA